MRLSHPGIALVCLFAARAHAWDDVTNPFGGGELWHTVTDTQDLWVLKVDLCAAGVAVRTTADGERGRTALSFANLVGAQAAVNGDFFGNGFNTDGPAAHDGAFWGAGVNHTYVAPISFGPAHVDIQHHNNEGPTPTWAKEVVSGHPTLLDDGAVVGSPGDPLCTNRHPRTAVGISQDHRSLILAVVDGRRQGAAGMTCDELAFVMAAHGAFDAVNMDGGGSSTMVVNGSVKNDPSDGSSRTVGNHLAIFAAGAGASPQCPDYTAPECAGDANRQSCDGSFITSCSEGAPIVYGDCGAFGAGCSTQGGAAHCVHPYCLLNLGGGEDGSFCTDAGLRATCALGVYVEDACPAESPCQENSATTATCGAPQEGEGEGESEGEGEGEGAGEGEGEGEAEGGEGEGDGTGEADGDGEGEALPKSVRSSSCATSAPALGFALLALLARRVRAPASTGVTRSGASPGARRSSATPPAWS